MGLGSFGGVWEERGWRGARDGSMAAGDAAYVKIVRPRTGEEGGRSANELSMCRTFCAMVEEAPECGV